MAKDPREDAKKILAAVLFLSACFSLFWQAVLKYQIQEYRRTRQSLEEIRAASGSAPADAANAAQREEVFLERVQKEVSVLERRLILEGYPPAKILSLLEEKGRGAGVEVVSCTFNAPVKGQKYARVPVCVGLRGEYPAIFNFVAGLEKGPAAVIIRTLKIEEEGSLTGAEVRATAAAARLLPAERISPAGSAAGAKDAPSPPQKMYRALLELEFCAFL